MKLVPRLKTAQPPSAPDRDPEVRISGHWISTDKGRARLSPLDEAHEEIARLKARVRELEDHIAASNKGKRTYPRAPMRSAYEEALIEFARRNPLFRAKDVIAKGIPTVMLTRLVAAGRLHKVARGVYSMSGPERTQAPNREFSELAIKVPRGVFCLGAALRFHEIDVPVPDDIWIAIPREGRRPKLENERVRYLPVSIGWMAVGVDERQVDRVRVLVTSVAKTVIDCFEYQHIVGLELAKAALTEVRRRSLCTAAELLYFASLTDSAPIIHAHLGVSVDEVNGLPSTRPTET